MKRGNHGIRQHPPEAKEEAIILASVLESSRQAAVELGIPDRTIREWIAEFRLMGDSELDAFIAQQKRLSDGLWAVEQIEALLFAQQLRIAGKARDYQSAMVSAGICETKLQTRGQPKIIDAMPSVTPSLLRQLPSAPTKQDPPVE
jgi:hypothetical protein